MDEKRRQIQSQPKRNPFQSDLDKLDIDWKVLRLVTSSLDTRLNIEMEWSFDDVQYWYGYLEVQEKYNARDAQIQHITEG